MSTLVCVPIMVRDVASALDDAAAAKAAGADIVEFRVDEFFSGEGMLESSGDTPEVKQLVALVSGAPLPCIVTCRAAAEAGGSGGFDGEEMSRVSLYERLGTAFGAGESPPRYLDIELAAYLKSANIKQKINLAVAHPEQVRDVRTALILSVHDFTHRPADLTRRLLMLRQQPAAAVAKVAYRLRSIRENLELFEILEQRDRPTIALGIGEMGLMSRVLAPKFGGFLTFAALRPAATTAPGQPTVAELLGLYRFRHIGPRTKVYGVIGWPVGHSRSPAVHNAGFMAAGFDGVYLPMPVAEGFESLKATLLEFIDHPRLDFCGCSVTLPHKEHTLRLAREQGWEIEPLAARLGAANTVVVDRDGASVRRVRVMNTDAAAAVECLRGALGPLAGERIAVIGAGGVARAVAGGALDAGATVVVYGRTQDKAANLAAELGAAFDGGGGAGGGKIVAADVAALPKSCCRAYVNCTPVGMAGGPDPAGSPVDVAALAACAKDAVFFDTVYAPRRTPMLLAAAAAGYRTIEGVRMFQLQAAEQFKAWTGRELDPSALDAASGDGDAARA